MLIKNQKTQNFCIEFVYKAQKSKVSTTYAGQTVSPDIHIPTLYTPSFKSSNSIPIESDMSISL